MLESRTIATVDAFWASYLGCTSQELNSDAPCIIKHGHGLADYFGILAFYRNTMPIISLPHDQVSTLTPLLKSIPAADMRVPTALAATLRVLRSQVFGPSGVSYADKSTLKPVPSAGRMLTKADKPAAAALQAACAETDWEQGGSKVGEQPAYGLFVGKQLAALAGYEVWDGTIVHLCVVTHPAFRGRGYARQVVAPLARHALDQGLIPQYRTLESNTQSSHVSDALGFYRLATSVAVDFSKPM